MACGKPRPPAALAALLTCSLRPAQPLAVDAAGAAAVAPTGRRLAAASTSSPKAKRETERRRKQRLQKRLARCLSSQGGVEAMNDTASERNASKQQGGERWQPQNGRVVARCLGLDALWQRRKAADVRGAQRADKPKWQPPEPERDPLPLPSARVLAAILVLTLLLYWACCRTRPRVRKAAPPACSTRVRR